MSDREKLIELLTEYYGADPAYYDVDAPSIANHLISHGVVVREWIPVTERLPEKQADVVALSNKDGGYMFVGYRGYISGEWMENGILHIGDVTHWMPLPEPPVRNGENDG